MTDSREQRRPEPNSGPPDCPNCGHELEWVCRWYGDMNTGKGSWSCSWRHDKEECIENLKKRVERA